jgi:hypothetical protein
MSEPGTPTERSQWETIRPIPMAECRAQWDGRRWTCDWCESINEVLRWSDDPCRTCHAPPRSRMLWHAFVPRSFEGADQPCYPTPAHAGRDDT